MTFRFGVFEFDDDSKELRKNGRAAAIEPQPAKALALLLQRAAGSASDRSREIVTREELRDAVWGQDTHVDFDRGLAYCVSQVRAALGDSGDNPRFVQTIPKQGFKFIAPVAATGAGAAWPDIDERSPRIPFGMRAALAILVAGLAMAWLVNRPRVETPPSQQTIIAVSIFDNETGNAEYDRLVAGLSDLVVEHMTKVAPDRIAVVGNAAILRQPRNIRNLKAVAQNLKADYVLLGQLQNGETGLRFITHFIRLKDETHLKANRLTMKDGGVAGLEDAVVQEFDRAVREHVLNTPDLKSSTVRPSD
jgi:DNA-binding winged helix-turn-helix (wHTH) protein/TolB-like protein